MKINLMDSSSPSLKKNPEIGITNSINVKAGQDCLFYGIEFSKEFFKETSVKIDWLIKEGDCLLKGQSCALIKTSSEDYEKVKDFVRACSYLSGVATLVCCYVESSLGIKVVGSESRNSSFNQWELKIIQEVKGFIRPLLPLSMISSKEQLPTVLKQKPNQIAVNRNSFSFQDLKEILEQIPKGIIKGVYGHFLPEDLEELSQLPIDVCWPELLQGGFPSVKLNIHIDEK